MKKVIFLKNAAILTVSSLLLRFLGIMFKVWLAANIGAEGIGLYQLIFSVYMLAATFATSGICTAVTRLVADELALGSKNGVLRILRKCLIITTFIAFISTAVIYFGAKPISVYMIDDVRAVPALKILSFSLPFMGISSCLRGYFIARRKASPSALSQLLEQGIRISIVILLIKKFFNRGISFTCSAVLLGDTISEIASVLFLWLLLVFDKKKLNSLSGRKNPPYRILKAITHIALPITAGRYLNTALRTIENLIVPRGLQSYGGNNSLSQFGMIKGMALPILFFPSTLLNSLSTLLIPEISEAAARKRTGLVKEATLRIIQITMLISFIFSAIFFTAGYEIGAIIYKSDDVGFLLCALSPIVPFMYLDSVADGILKGLDQQSFCFRTGITDSILRIALIISFLPHFGMKGFICIMYFSNFLTCFLNVMRLIKISKAKIDIITSIFLPISFAFSITFIFKNILNIFNFSNLVYIILICVASIPIYILFLFLFKCITKDELKNILPKR